MFSICSSHDFQSTGAKAMVKAFCQQPLASLYEHSCQVLLPLKIGLLNIRDSFKNKDQYNFLIKVILRGKEFVFSFPLSETDITFSMTFEAV